MTKLRCHLLIGPPASGKTSLSKILAPIVNAKILSTDEIRQELWGDEMSQGPWKEIEKVLNDRLRNHVSKRQSVIIDATHAKRPWRLAFTQKLNLDQKIEWIGWWMTTPREICLKWNRKRKRIIEPEVIDKYCEALKNKTFNPHRSEGFASIVEFDPSIGDNLSERLNLANNELNKRIGRAQNKEKKKELHGYSRLLDLERLLFLAQLISRFPGLSASDEQTRKEMETICNPLPQGSMSDRASKLLTAIHNSDCYSDKDSIENDLNWLKSQGFLDAKPSQKRIEPPKANKETSKNLGGWPPMAEKQVFVRVMTLLRYVLQNPFDYDKENSEGLGVHDYYINRLGDSIYGPGETQTFRQDINKVLRPYGFRKKSNDNTRHGYGIGTAVLSAERLIDLSHLLEQTVQRLGDPTAHTLHDELNERLKWASIKNDEPSLRIFANRSLINPDFLNKQSVAQPTYCKRLEQAITSRKRVVFEKFSTSAAFSESAKKNTLFEAWPLQLIFHNIAWYLAYAENINGKKLITCERLDRMALRKVESTSFTEISKEERITTLNRLHKLIEISGGIFFGSDVEKQYLLTQEDNHERKRHMILVRFRCTKNIYKFLREEPQRYPQSQLRMSQPKEEDKWEAPSKGPFVLKPIPGESHPYPIEIDLPPWIINEKNIDFRSWLYGFGTEIIIEKPNSLVSEYIKRTQDINNLYQN